MALNKLDTGNTMFETMVPVLIQCFGLIMLGFVAGRLKLLTHSQAKGLGIYVTSFALPAIFFTVLVSIEFADVDWYLVLAVSLGKAIAFFCTMAIVFLFSLGKSFGAAGIMSIFVSQSNDVALSYPVLKLLYPDLAHYIYLFAPTQLVLLNPFGYFVLEWHRTQEKLALNTAMPQRFGPAHKTSVSTFRKILKVARFVASNPLFFMTLLGVVFNFILKHQMPSMLQGFFSDLGSSFNATALFYLGFSMVGKLKSIERRGVYILVFILTAKVIISPFITREVTKLLTSNQAGNVSLAKSNFAFLYAATPTAPPVFLFASKYGVFPEVISAGLVIGTFLYAPIMFLLGGMATLVDVDPQFYDSTLERGAVYLSWASVLCCAWVFAVLFVTKKACRMPYRFLLCLTASVMVFCTTLAFGSIWEPINWRTTPVATWGQYMQFIIFFIACTASRVWTTFLSIAVLYQVRYKRCLPKCIQFLLYILGGLIPFVVTSILMMSTGSVSTRDVNPAFHYGKAQQICSAIVLCICLSVSLLSLVCTFRSNASFSLDGDTAPNAVDDEQGPLISPELESSLDDPAILTNSSGNEDIGTELPPIQPTSVTDANLLPAWENSDDEVRCREPISLSNSDHIQEMSTAEVPQPIHQTLLSSATEGFHRFLILNILLLISMFFGVCICIWRLTREAEAGVFIAVEFLDQAFNFGQGILIFSVFGFDTDLIINPIINGISTMRYWVSSNLSWPSLRMARRLKEEEVERFVVTQLPICMQQICTNIRLSGQTLESVFYFKDFHKWISQKSAAEGCHQLHADTASLLMALATRNLIRRLTGTSEGTGGVEHEESASSDASTVPSPQWSRLNEVAGTLYQFLGSS